MSKDSNDGVTASDEPLQTASATTAPSASETASTTGFANKIEGTDATALSLAVAKQFFKDPKTVGVATTDDFADALAGGAQVAEKDGPIILAPKEIPTSIKEYLTGNKTVTQVYVYGGPTRFSDAQLGELSK